MIWATRVGCHIDRAACAWLILRFVDPDATFTFVEDPDDVPRGAMAFDMPGVDLSHHDGDCSFETILKRHSLDDPVLWDLAEIVHEADLGDDRFDAPEAAGLDAVLRGLTLVRGDQEIIEIASAVFDGLYEQRRRAIILDQPSS